MKTRGDCLSIFHEEYKLDLKNYSYTSFVFVQFVKETPANNNKRG